jgi:hypothetical protein
MEIHDRRGVPPTLGYHQNVIYVESGDALKAATVAKLGSFVTDSQERPYPTAYFLAVAKSIAYVRSGGKHLAISSEIRSLSVEQAHKR